MVCDARIYSGAGRRARDSPARLGPLRELKALLGFAPRLANRRAIFDPYRAWFGAVQTIGCVAAPL